MTWNVAGTNLAPVSTANVDIFLSTDGGLTFDHANPLASGTPNDGSHSVTLPNITTSQARIMVKGSNNIFFDISNQNFSFSPPPAITSPTPGSVLNGSSVTFQWTANGTAVQEWWLYVGSTAGASNLYDSGSLGTQLAHTVTGLPTDGSQIFVRLWYKVGGTWQSRDFPYTTPLSFPNIQGNYAMTGTETATGCSDPTHNGTFGVSVNANINNQTGANFSGTIQGTDSTDPSSGTLNGTIAQNGSVTGTFFINLPANDQSQGTFNGSLSGNTLSLNFSGMDIQDTCSFTGSITGSR